MSFNLRNRSLLTVQDYTPREFRYLLDLARDLKRAKYARTEQKHLDGKEICLIFEKTSTRTRCAFEVACYDQGAHVTYLDPAGSQIGHKESLTSNMRDSLTSLQRLVGFLANVVGQAKNGKDVKARVKTLSRDVVSIADHASFLSQKITFLLDATLGMINIEQNAIIKIVSVAAVVFLPPTLVASIYGMNFDAMPELKWMLGYPWALGLMVLSAVLPFWWFRRKGWL